jgi:class 3 adenylate cyclase
LQLETDVQPSACSMSPEGGGERHHAVIVFADVVGYSRLMADDEPGTLKLWTALYSNVLKPEAEGRRGQVGDLRGDGILLEFEQVADAPEWSRLAHRAAAATGIGDTAPLTHAFSWMLWSTTLSFVGRAEEALARAQHALVLSRQDQSRYLYLSRVAIAHFAAGNMPEAVRWARLCRDGNPGYTANLRYLIAAHVRLGSLAEARAIAGDLMRPEPEFRLATFARRRQPFRQPETGAAYLEGLRAAGLPD